MVQWRCRVVLRHCFLYLLESTNIHPKNANYLLTFLSKGKYALRVELMKLTSLFQHRIGSVLVCLLGYTRPSTDFSLSCVGTGTTGKRGSSQLIIALHKVIASSCYISPILYALAFNFRLCVYSVTDSILKL
jgi:hypothetical protein